MSKSVEPTLETLRSQIDQIDDHIHDLLMERTLLVERIGVLKSDNTLALRPGREAQILRRLDDRHMGAFPKSSMIRIWREILGSLTHLQRPMSIAVAQGQASPGFIELVRDHFGVTPQVKPVASPGEVIKLVTEDVLSVGVVPLPGVTAGGQDAWWASLTAENAPKIILRLPFYPFERTDPVEGLVVAKRPHEQTGNDRTFLVIETAAAVSLDRTRSLVSKAGFIPTGQPSSLRMGDLVLFLLEVEDWVAPSDPRLSALVRDHVTHATIIGGYPVPLTGQP